MDSSNQKLNNSQNTKTKANIDELCSIENDILCLGDIINELLNILKLELEGRNCIDDCKSKLNEIFSLIDKIKKNMHKLVDEVYSKKNFVFCSKISNDLKEKEKEIAIIIKNYFKPYCQDTNKNFPNERKFSVNKK